MNGIVENGHESGDSCSTCDAERGDGAEGRGRETVLEQLHKVAHDMRVKWADWDRGVGGYEVTLEIREVRERFDALIEQWYEFRGSEEPVKELKSWVANTDAKIAKLNDVLEREVGSWETDAMELWDKWRAGGGGSNANDRWNNGSLGANGQNLGVRDEFGELGGLAAIATEAADMLIELSIYRSTHEKIFSQLQKERLSAVEEILNNIDKGYKNLEKQKRRKDDQANLYSAYSTFSYRKPVEYHHNRAASSSEMIGSYEEFLQNAENANIPSATGKSQPVVSEEVSDPLQNSETLDASSLAPTRPSPAERTTHKLGAGHRRAPSVQFKQGNTVRSALHDKPSPNLGRPRPVEDTSENAYNQLPSSPRPLPSGRMGGPLPPQSFSSSLYRTLHRRQTSVQDLGSLLEPSRVKGDGRCMFRAVARSRAAATGNLSSWNDTMEREVADILRSKACDALLDHRNLLKTFYVVEGDFDRYVRGMRNTKQFGGEPELLMLARILHVPISVYIDNGQMYRQIQVYGRVYQGNPVRILLQGQHYDCLLPKRSRKRSAQKSRAYTHVSQYRENQKHGKSSRASSDLSKRSLNVGKHRKGKR